MISPRCTFLAAVAGAALPFAAVAQDSTASVPEARVRPAPITGEESPLTFEISPRGQFQLRSDLDSAGRVSVYRAGGDLAIGMKISEDVRITLTGGGENSWYRFSGATGLIAGAGNPIDSATTATFGPGVFWRIDEDWSAFGSGYVEFAGESDIFRDDARRWGGLGGARYRFSDDLALSFGVSYATRFRETARVIPILGAEWKITERLRFDTRGPGAALTYSLTDTVDIAFRGEYQRREFRLDEDRALLPNGILIDSAVPIGLEVSWTPAPWVTLSAQAGAVVWQEYSVRDREGNKVGVERTDPAAYLGVFARIRF